MDLKQFYNVVAMLFILTLVGFFGYKLGAIKGNATKAFSKLIICIGQPCMIVNAFLQYEYSSEKIFKGLKVLGLSFALHILLAVIAFAACKLFKFREYDEAKATEFAIIFGNCGFLGFPLMESLFPEDGLFLAAFFNVGFQIAIWTWGMSIIARKRNDVKLTVKKIFLNYGTIPCLFGIIIYILSQYFPVSNGAFDFVYGALKVSISNVSAICTPISIITTGALLATRKTKQIVGDVQIYYLSAVKLLAAPLIVCLVSHLCGLGDEFTLFLTIMAALPAASTVSMLAELYDLAPGYCSQAVGVSSVLSVATMPIVLEIAKLIMKI